MTCLGTGSVHIFPFTLFSSPFFNHPIADLKTPNHLHLTQTETSFLNKAMAKREINYRLGKIEYEYNDQVPWTEMDQHMADVLAHCLLANDQSSEVTDAIFKRGIELSEHIKRIDATHGKVGELLKKAQDIAGGYVGAIELGKFAIADMIVEATNEASEAIQQQNKEATAVHAHYSKLIDDRNQKVEQDEMDIEEIYGKLNGLLLLGYQAEDVATDLVSFDRASEMVRAVLSVGDQGQGSKLDAVYNKIRDFELLLAKIDGQQKVWEEYCSRLILIEYIGKLRSGNQPTSFN